MKMLGLILLSSALGLSVFAAPALAGPRYHARDVNQSRAPLYGDGGYGEAPTPTGFVFQRHSARCEYPHGWSVTDFTRTLNGIPRSSSDLIETGCAADEPLQP